MSKGVIIHLDDEEKHLTDSKQTKKQLEINLDLICCKTKEEFTANINEYSGSVKCLIFDLLGANPNKQEMQKDQAEFLDYVKDNFAKYNIPIFIYSGWLDQIEDIFDNCGTVFKISKDEGLFSVYEKIKSFEESGFIEVFCPGGILEKELHLDLHKSFTQQFRQGEIEKIISTVDKQESDYKERLINIFKRIAIRSLMSDILAPTVTDRAGFNPIEHYYRRISHIDLWTGDILKHRTNKDCILIITPRCNVGSDTALLVCPIEVGAFPSKTSSKGKEEIRGALTNNPEFSGYNRHLPPSPIFEGGKVLLSKYSIISREVLKNEYERLITLSDELTNEILGKFGAYFFRTGITPWNPNEVVNHIENSKQDAKAD